MTISLGPAIFFASLAGVGFALALYWKESTFDVEDSLAYRLRILSCIFRFLAVGVLTFLLLSPFIQKTEFVSSPHKIKFLVDASSSADFVDDDLLVRKLIDESKEYLGDSVEIEEVYFSHRLHDNRKTTSLRQTDITKSIEEALRFHATTTDAFVLVSDGIHNANSNPYTVLSDKPIYTVGTGLEEGLLDLEIVEVRHPKVARIGDEVEIQVDCQAKLLDGTQVTLNIFSNDGVNSMTSTFFIRGDNLLDTTLKFILLPETEGLQEFSIQATSDSEELTLANNSASWFIDVKDSKQKVLFCAAGPHPDIRPIRRALSEFQTLEVDLHFIKDGPPDSKDYDAIIWHNLPDKESPFDLLKARNIPQLYIVGAATSVDYVNAKIKGLSFPNNSWSALRKIIFQPASIPLIFPIDVMQRFEEMPKLRYPSGVVHSSLSTSYTMLTEVDGDPVLLNLSDNYNRKFVLIGEGWWTWYMAEHRKFGNTEAFNALFQQLVNELVQDYSQDRLWLSVSPTRPHTFDDVVFSLKGLNAEYEEVIPQDIVLDIKSTEGSWDSTLTNFSVTENGVSSEPLTLKRGSYFVNAKARVANTSQTAAMGLVVADDNREYNVTQRDTGLLQYIAETTGGSYNDIKDPKTFVASLSRWIQENPKDQSVLTQTLRINEIFWLCLALTFLGIEWVLRKYAGSF